MTGPTAPFPSNADVRIRPYSLDDAEVLRDAIHESIRELVAWMPWCHPDYSLDEARRWVEEQSVAFRARKEFQFAIIDGSGAFLGACGLNDIDRVDRRANLGYWVRTQASGRSVATSAVRALHDWAFAETDLIRLEIVVAVENHASRRVAEKAGARKEGRLRRRLLLDGEAVDAFMYAFTRDPAGASSGTRCRH